MTRADAIAAFKASSSGGLTNQPGNSTVAAYFGLFTGNAANPSAPDGRLTGSHPIGPLPAWLVVVDGLKIVGSGGGGVSPGSPPTTQELPGPGYALNVLRDGDGQNLTGVSETGGTASDTGIE
jgi:hypothetical protein